MPRYLIIDNSKKVVNAVEWDGDVNRWTPPAGHTFRLEPGRGNIGDTFDGVNYVPPAPPPPDKQSALNSELDAIAADVTTVGRFRQLVLALRAFFNGR
jgi:hypothetical protein